MFPKIRALVVVVLSLSSVMASHPTRVPPGLHRGSQTSLPPNIVIVVLDDVGVDKLSFYGAVPATGGAWDATTPAQGTLVEKTAALPNMNLLCNRGVRFEHAYATPLCSPSRAELLSGLYGHQTGMLHLSETPVIAATGGGYTLAPSNLLPAVLKTRGYRCGAFGKWHLTVASDTCHPIQCGFDVFAGHMDNNESPQDGSFTCNHFKWPLVMATAPCTDTPVAHETTVYDAESARIEARQFIDQQTGAPFFAYVCFHPPHYPFQLPPIHMVSAGTLADIEALNGWTDDSQYVEGDIANVQASCDSNTPEHFKARLYYRAALESIDWEIGQLLHSNPATGQVTDLDNTIVLVVGDNGTPNEAVQSVALGAGTAGAPYPSNHAKRTIYELGIRVPLIAYGPPAFVDPQGSTCDAMISLVDVWKTCADLGGATPTIALGADSRSFASAMAHPTGSTSLWRTEVYTEIASSNGFLYTSGSPTPSWSPAAPSTFAPPAYNISVSYSRAVITSNGTKYIRRCVPDGAQDSPNGPCASGSPLSGGGCLPTAQCGVPCACGASSSSCAVQEEFYQVFGPQNPDPNEVETLCAWMSGGEKDVLRCLLSDKTGN